MTSRLYHIVCGFRSVQASTACSGRLFACANSTCPGLEFCTLLQKELSGDGSFRTSESRRFSSTSSKPENSSLAESKESVNQVTLSLGEKVKQTTKDASYLGIIIGGITVTGIMFYAIFRELFSGRSPNSVYTRALKRVRKDDGIILSIGEPIKGYGELSSRGRRRHVSHVEYIKDGINYMRMKFYIEGSLRKGTVHLEVRENEKHDYEYRYLFVDLETTPTRTIVLEDNRQNDMATGDVMSL